MKRRLFVTSNISVALGGCAPVSNALNNNAALHHVISYDGTFNRFAIGRGALARSYPHSAITPIGGYPIDSLPTAADPLYADLGRHGFAITVYRSAASLNGREPSSGLPRFCTTAGGGCVRGKVRRPVRRGRGRAAVA